MPPAVRLKYPRQMPGTFPVGQALVGGGVPAVPKLVAAEQSCRTATGKEHAGMHQFVDANIVGLGHVDGVARLSLVQTEGFEPINAEACVGIVATSPLRPKSRPLSG